MKNKIYIIIVTYNNQDSITRCMSSILRQSNQNYQLCIIDNNSSDRTLSTIRTFLEDNTSLREKTEVLENNINTGFSKAVNRGIKKALLRSDIEVLLLLNPDVSCTQDLLENGACVFKTYENIGAAGPKILYPDHKIWWIGTKLYSDKELLFSLRYGVGEHIDKGQYFNATTNELKEVDALTGCVMFIPLQIAAETGLFNEKYFMYVEDIDYSLRIKQKGYKLQVFTKSTVFHDVHDQKKNFRSLLSNGKKYKIYLTSVGLFLLEHKPFYFFIVWLLKIPLSLAFQYLKRKI